MGASISLSMMDATILLFWKEYLAPSGTKTLANGTWTLVAMDIRLSINIIYEVTNKATYRLLGASPFELTNASMPLLLGALNSNKCVPSSHKVVLLWHIATYPQPCVKLYHYLNIVKNITKHLKQYWFQVKNSYLFFQFFILQVEHLQYQWLVTKIFVVPQSTGHAHEMMGYFKIISSMFSL